MVTRVRRHQINPDDEEAEFREDYEPSFNNASNESDNSLLFLGGLVGLTAILGVLGTVSSSDYEMLETLTPTSEAAADLGYASEFLQDYQMMELEVAEKLIPDDLTHLNQMMEEGKQYGRMSDPKTAENITYNNSSNISERIGQFGYHEASVQGNLEVAKNEGILFPWVSVGDNNVCDECLELEADGPYPADDYPESPHYGDRCNEPFPDPIIALSGDTETEYQEIDNLEDHVENGDMKEQIESLDTDKLKDVEDYSTDNGYEVLNEFARTGEVPEGSLSTAEELEQQNKNINELINEVKTDADMKLFRGAEDSYDALSVGTIIEDPALLSTSTDIEIAEGFTGESNTILEIHYPEGSPGLPVSEALDVNDLRAPFNESEMLLPRNTPMEVIGSYSRELEWGGTYNIVQVKPI